MRKLFWLLLFIHFSTSASEIDQILQNVPSGECWYLSEFFKACVRQDHFGYTIFFDKPVSRSYFFIKCPSREMDVSFLNKKLANGWKIWKKYESYLQHPNYIFCEEIKESYNLDLKSTIKICHIYLINKKALLTLLKEQELLFNLHLGNEFSPEVFLNKIETTKKLTPHLNESEALLGVILGYGIRSSFRFEEVEKSGLQLNELSNWTPISSLQPEGCPINPVVFIGDVESEEDQRIISHYSSQIEKIWKIYKDSEFLLKVLQQLSR